MDSGVVILRRSARGLPHPLEGSVFIPAILNSLSPDQMHAVGSSSSFLLNDSVAIDIKSKELDRADTPQ